MPQLEPIAIFMNLFRTVATFIFLIIIIILFFSLKVTILNDDLQRFNMELSDALSGTKIASDRSVYSAAELTKLETTTKEIELYARYCDYGYVAEITSLAKTYCENGEPCAGFCNSACGTGSECRCNIEVFGNNFCECKKNDKWISSYDWKFGNDPESYYIVDGTIPIIAGGLYQKASSTFPAAVDTGQGVIQAELNLITYDSLLTRLSCVTQKAYETKTMKKIDFDPSKIPTLDPLFPSSLIFHRTDEDGTHACLYQNSDLNEVPLQCRYMPDVPFIELRQEWISLEKAKSIEAYPLKVDEAECPPKPEEIATVEDEVSTVILCVR